MAAGYLIGTVGGIFLYAMVFIVGIMGKDKSMWECAPFYLDRVPYNIYVKIHTISKWLSIAIACGFFVLLTHAIAVDMCGW
jgi:hypothetical protein